MKFALFIGSVIAQDFIPTDWDNNDVWQDNTYCVEAQDNFLVFEATESVDGVLATRDGCFAWCKDQYEFLGANCCSQAFFGTTDQSYFIAYCALYFTNVDTVTMNKSEEGGTITAFTSTSMYFPDEESVTVEDEPLDIDLMYDFYDNAFAGVEELPQDEEPIQEEVIEEETVIPEEAVVVELTYDDFMQDVNALVQKYNLSDAIQNSKYSLVNIWDSSVPDREALSQSLESVSEKVGGNIVDDISDSDIDWMKNVVSAWANQWGSCIPVCAAEIEKIPACPECEVQECPEQIECDYDLNCPINCDDVLECPEPVCEECPINCDDVLECPEPIVCEDKVCLVPAYIECEVEECPAQIECEVEKCPEQIECGETELYFNCDGTLLTEDQLFLPEDYYLDDDGLEKFVPIQEDADYDTDYYDTLVDGFGDYSYETFTGTDYYYDDSDSYDFYTDYWDNEEYDIINYDYYQFDDEDYNWYDDYWQNDEYDWFDYNYFYQEETTADLYYEAPVEDDTFFDSVWNYMGW